MLYHALVTRFNVNEATWKTNKNNLPVANEIWLEKRINLFLNFCYPSVVNQQCKNFFWYIFFEDGTQKALKKVLNVLEKHSFIKPIFVNGMGGFNDNLHTSVLSNMPSNTKRIISTRLDNDDALHKNFILNLQQANFSHLEKFILDFPEGLCLKITGKPKLSIYKSPKNQFISLVEKIKEKQKPDLVFGEFHHKIDLIYSVKTMPFKRQWIQLVHEDNLVNSFKGSLTFKKSLEGYPEFNVKFSKTYNLEVFEFKIKAFLNKLPGYYKLKIIIKKFNL